MSEEKTKELASSTKSESEKKKRTTVNRSKSSSVEEKKPVTRKRSTAKKASQSSLAEENKSTVKKKGSSKTTGTRKTASKKTDTKNSTTAKKEQPDEVKNKDEKALNEAVNKNTASFVLPKKTLPNNIPDMSNLTLKERLKKLGQESSESETEEKEEKQEEQETETVKEKELPRAIDRIRSTIEKDSSNEEEVKVKKLKIRRGGEVLSLKMILIVITVIILFLCSLIFIRLQENKRELELGLFQRNGDIIFEIKEGMSASEVSKALGGVVNSKELLEYLKKEGLSSSLMAGSYRVPIGVSIEDLSAVITNKNKNRITIFDGYTLTEIDSMLTNRGLISGGDFINAVHRIKEERSLPFEEGYFLSGNYIFKDAYTLAKEMQDELISLLLLNGEALLREDLSLDEVVILSSMVNRETQDRQQMGVIAKVMLNRYREDMPLGIDATTRYELGSWNGKIDQSVYEKETPYNTRRKKGLPPTGIGCPGKDAILAVLTPENTSALYYLHDESGSLYTSNSYEEHLLTYDKVH